MPNKLQGNHGSTHRAGHTMGDFPKKTSIGNGKLKKSAKGRKKPSRGQGK